MVSTHSRVQGFLYFFGVKINVCYPSWCWKGDVFIRKLKLSAVICGVSCVQNVVQSACHKKQARLIIKEILQYAQKSVYNSMRGEQHGVRGRFSNSLLGMRRINVERSTELGRRFDKGQLLTLRYLTTKGAFINPNPKAVRRFVFPNP